MVTYFSAHSFKRVIIAIIVTDNMENELECLSLASFYTSLLLDNKAETCPSVVPFSK
jgi:hypothetical protein